MARFMMKTNPQLPGFAVRQDPPSWALPATILTIGLVLTLFLPPEALFLVVLSAAIGTGITVAEWRRAPDAPQLGPDRGD
jgi:hypothetical protein